MTSKRSEKSNREKKLKLSFSVTRSMAPAKIRKTSVIDETPFYTKQEVAKHNTDSDCWIVINGNVYNITPYIKIHPGGSRILLRKAGGDCTLGFTKVRHSEFAKTTLEKYYIGNLKVSELIVFVQMNGVCTNQLLFFHRLQVHNYYLLCRM